MEQIIQLPVEKVVATVQVRTEFSEPSLRGLADTLLTVGQQQPIRVRKDGDDLFVVIDGERRLLAAKMAGLPTIAAIVDEEQELTPAAIRHRQLVSNCQRDNLKPMETAVAIAELMEETGWTATEAASKLGLSNATVSRLLALVKKLPAAIQSQVRAGAIPASSAYELGKIEDVGERDILAAQIVGGELTRDCLSELVKRKGNGHSDADAQSAVRIKAALSDGRSITVAGVSSLDVFINSLLELAAKAKKLRAKGTTLAELAKLLRDEAKA